MELSFFAKSTRQSTWRRQMQSCNVAIVHLVVLQYMSHSFLRREEERKVMKTKRAIDKQGWIPFYLFSFFFVSFLLFIFNISTVGNGIVPFHKILWNGPNLGRHLPPSPFHGALGSRWNEVCASSHHTVTRTKINFTFSSASPLRVWHVDGGPKRPKGFGSTVQICM